MQKNKKIKKTISLFSGGGIGEIFLKDINIDVILANELVKGRVDFYKALHINECVLNGDITDLSIKEKIKEKIVKENPEILIATPPCQGASTVGKNKNAKDMTADPRNLLIFDIIDLINYSNFKYILIENVPRYLKLTLPYNGKFLTVEEILKLEFSGKYEIEIKVLNVKDYGVPQNRKRAEKISKKLKKSKKKKGDKKG